MGKNLEEMTLKELWALFPIFLAEHSASWDKWYCEERKRLANILPTTEEIKINHIGSMAICNIWAKPIVDILDEIPKSSAMKDIKQVLIANNYICMSEEDNIKSFNRGYTSEGFAEKVFHLHLN